MDTDDLAKKFLVLNKLLEKHATQPWPSEFDAANPWKESYKELRQSLHGMVPDYQSFIRDFFDEEEFKGSAFQMATCIALYEAKCEILMKRDEELGKPTDDGHKAYLRYKLLFRLREEFSKEVNTYIDTAKGSLPKEVIARVPIL